MMCMSLCVTLPLCKLCLPHMPLPIEIEEVMFLGAMCLFAYLSVRRVMIKYHPYFHETWLKGVASVMKLPTEFLDNAN